MEHEKIIEALGAIQLLVDIHLDKEHFAATCPPLDAVSYLTNQILAEEKEGVPKAQSRLYDDYQKGG